MKKSNISIIFLLSLFVLNVMTPIIITQVVMTDIENPETIISIKSLVDKDNDKIDDELTVYFENSDITSLETVIIFENAINSIDKLNLKNQGAEISSKIWDSGRRIKVNISPKILRNIANLPGVQLITTAEIRYIMIAIEGEDFSNLAVLEQEFEECEIFWNIGVALIRYYSGIENDIRKLGSFTVIADVSDAWYTIQATEENSDFTTNTQQSIEAIHADEMWSLGFTGEGMKIGNMDSGINIYHDDLEGRVIEAESFIKVIYGYEEDDTSIADPNGHGSHTSGIIAGNGTVDITKIGVAPKSELYFARVGVPSGSSVSATLPSLVAAIDWLIGFDIDTLNLSFGGSDDVGDNIVETMFKNIARNEDILTAVSAGNEGTLGWYTAGTPGTTDDVITVGIIDATTSTFGVVAYTGRGPTADEHMKPDVLAPGYQISSVGPIGNSYITLSGTSMSAPHVTGALALLIQACNSQGISVNPGVLKAALMQTATPFSGIDPLIQGRGYINVKAAWDYILAADLNGTIPEIGACNPVQQPLSLWSDLLQGQVTEQYLTCVSPFTSGLTLEVTGTAADFVTIGALEGKYTYVSKITYEIPVSTTIDEYTGTITFKHSGKVMDTVDIVLNVIESNGNRMLLNFNTTDWSIDHMYGQYREFTSDMLEKGWVISEQKITLTEEILANYEAIWFPDPFSISFPNGSYNDFSNPYAYNALTSNEKEALHNYLEDGGSVFFCFNGRSYDADLSLYYGTDVEEINSITEIYGIHVTDEYWPAGSPGVYDIYTPHPLTSGVEAIDHFGCHISVTGDAELITKRDAYSTYGNLAVYENDNGGRLVVITTNFVFDNEGYINNYNPGETNNDLFAQNLVRWTTAQHRIKQQNYTASGFTLDMTYEYISGPGADFGGYVVTPTGKQDDLSWSEISSGVWQCTYYFTELGEHQIFVECGPSGVDEFDYFLVTATDTTRTGGIWIPIIILISFFGLTTSVFIQRRKK
ncbi:MAG: hypothetical protein EAX90_08410 [Candidatus Heimdallarchaeota archaeon]|nr:hypothetical protein [Candidatus Heimdallarchaeota archaeon]